MKKPISIFFLNAALFFFLSAFSFRANAGIRIVQVGFGGNAFSPASFSICLGDTIYFVWSGGMHNVHITNPPTAPSSDLMAPGDTFKYIPSASGFYDFQCDYHAPIMAGTFTVNAMPSANAGSGATICLGTSITLNGSGSGTFLWSPGTGLSCTTCPDPVASPSTTTNYSLTATNGCGSVTDAITITVDSVTATVSADTTICNGGSAVLTASGGIVYNWYPTGETTPSITVFPTTTSTYTVIVINANDCADTATVTVTVKPLLIVSFIPADASCPTCSDGSASVNVAGGFSPYTYLWMPTAQTTLTATGLSPGNYMFCVTDSLGCSACGNISLGPVCDTLKTTFAGGNRQDGNMFDVAALSPLIINSFDINVADDGDKKVGIRIFYKQGSYVGFESDSTAWTQIDTVTITNPNATGIPTPVPIQVNVGIAANQTVAFYITTSTTSSVDNLEYKNGTARGSAFSQDANLLVKEGIGIAYPFGSIFPTGGGSRIWNGIIHYCTSATAGINASAGQGLEVKVFPNPFHASATLELSGLDNLNKEVIVFDLFGKEVIHTILPGGTNSTIIERGDLSPGLYFYKVKCENGTMGTGKVIVE